MKCKNCGHEILPDGIGYKHVKTVRGFTTTVDGDGKYIFKDEVRPVLSKVCWCGCPNPEPELKGD